MDQTSGKEIKEQGLLLAIVLWIAGCEFTGPIDGQAQRLHLSTHVGDIVVGPCFGVTTNCHRSVFRRHAECIPTHWVQDVVTGADLIPRDYVAHGVVAHVTHVDASRWIWKHL